LGVFSFLGSLHVELFCKKRHMSVNFSRVVLVGKDSFASASVEPIIRMEAKKLFNPIIRMEAKKLFKTNKKNIEKIAPRRRNGASSQHRLRVVIPLLGIQGDTTRLCSEK